MQRLLDETFRGDGKVVEDEVATKTMFFLFLKRHWFVRATLATETRSCMT